MDRSSGAPFRARIHNLATVSQNIPSVQLIHALLFLSSWRDFHKSEEEKKKLLQRDENSKIMKVQICKSRTHPAPHGCLTSKELHSGQSAQRYRNCCFLFFFLFFNKAFCESPADMLLVNALIHFEFIRRGERLNYAVIFLGNCSRSCFEEITR